MSRKIEKDNKKYLTLFFILLAFTFNTCTEEEIFFTPGNGTYEGIFTIVESNNSTQSGKVTFTLSNNNYSSSPEKRYLPPAGGGAFQINKNKIFLEDKIIHTADFDWTLILNGEFEFTYDGVKLILTQNDLQFNRFRKIELIKQN
ncbi:MAG TPA: hypothetical protein VLN45_12735 [Ignavibacteriaceae bacterium]|nr:hypothetical protein [Ignavibacteriaceae bacterium]